MGDENEDLVDFWGNPWTPEPDPRGRKRHKRSPEVAEKVSVLRATGQSVEQIAARLVLSEPTLRKYYFRELESGSALAEAVLTEAIWKKARDGNVSAARYIQGKIDKGAAIDAESRIRSRPAKVVPLGKKEQRQLDAKAIGGRFSTPAPPKLVVDNG